MFNFFNRKKVREDIENSLSGYDVITEKIEKKNTVYKRTRMSNFGLKLHTLYTNLPMWKIILITIVTAIVFGVISVFFVKNVGIYNFGLAAFGQAAARILVTELKADQVSEVTRNLIDQFVFWVLYIILSIPIFIFGYKKIGKLFTNLTVLFLAISSLVSFSIGLIPNANHVYLIGNFDNSEIKNVLPEFKKALSGIIPLLWSDGGNIIALMIYAVVYGYLLAWIFAIIQIIGGTAGVTGVIGEWYANEKQKSFGSISGYMNIIIVLISVAVGSWLPGSLLLEEAKSEQILSLKTAANGLENNVHQILLPLADTISKGNVISDNSINQSIQTFNQIFNSGAETNQIASAIAYDLTKYQGLSQDGSIYLNHSDFDKLLESTKTILSRTGYLTQFNALWVPFSRTLEVIDKAWTFELYLSPNFVATILTNIIYIITLNKLYPKFKLVKIEIFSEQWEQIKCLINEDKRIVTGMTIFKARGGYKNTDVNVITSITLFRQVVRIIKKVHAIDPDAFISISEVSSIDGYVYLPENKF
ncbi:YitT family protein [Mycoplasma buteonis]|uniref:YitT family protein n=1 Tax=Mycoplasma buteonis TaxID=171280 RepID=UPI000A04A7A1|nr:YitT family protein [Mycoplasma buteonis]